jgi:1-acyl-sn-glycerol-3-phosphate acyltransferase
MKSFVVFLYQLIVWVPVCLAATVSCALITIIGCFLGGERIFSYYPGKWWSRVMCAVSLCPVTVRGRENLRRGQSYIFIANHQGAYDIFLLYGYLNTPIKWVMKQILRRIQFVGKACEMAGFIFVDNSSPVAAARTISEAEQRLKNGDSIAIFPEGSRTQTGAMGKFKKGAFQMALDMKLPVVPVTIQGSFDVMPRSSVILHPHPMELIIHEPIPTAAFASTDLRETAQNIRTLLDRSREAIASGLA